ncbi:MAG: gliding motility-associated C-terminal domain-containing protein [Flavobacteriales bacterium]|nr:gliding motility-associated C-terminal domain-containing protein [Flavobacteriales bacterium]
MKALISLLIVVACTLAASAQVVLDRQVISPFAITGSINTTVRINSTAGQVEFTTISASDGHLTQGFHQPRVTINPTISYTVSQDACSGVYTITVDGIQPCTNPIPLEYLWDGIPGGSSLETTAVSVDLTVSTADCTVNMTVVPASGPVTVTPCGPIFYSVITPNGDGNNDIWFIDNLSSDWLNNEVEIFNRWGMSVWKNSNYNNSDVLWTGESNEGHPLPDGTYFFTLTAGENNYSGFIELQR